MDVILDALRILSDFLWWMGGVIFLVISGAGLVFTVFDIFQFRTNVIEWWKRRLEFAESIRLLNASDYFLAHIIHLGGEFSTIYSLQVTVNEEGGYYLNPPRKFVSVGFNRGGDRMIIGMSEFSSHYGNFVVESFADSSGNTFPSSYPEICHLPITEMKNEYTVKFVRKADSRPDKVKL